MEDSRQEGEGNRTAGPNLEGPLLLHMLEGVTEVTSCWHTCY